MNREEFISKLAELDPSSTFLSLKGYKNSAGEVADYNIVFHISYENALKKSINALEKTITANDLHEEARLSLLDGYNKSLAKVKDTPVDELEDNYKRFYDNEGKVIKGVKLHAETDTLHLFGMLVNKKVTVPGTYKQTNKRELTKAKDELRKLCSVNKFRQFKITPEQVQSISVGKLSLLPPEIF